MHVLNANDLFGITAYTYDRIMEIGGKHGPDAFAVYFKLLEQTRIQGTNQTFTLDIFLEKFFGWGNKRLSVAKGILKDLGLIDNVVVRDELGRMKAHYVRVNYLIDDSKVRNACSTYSLSTGAEIHGVDSSTGGEMETNALSTKYINAGSTKQEIHVDSEENTDISQDDTGESKTARKTKPKRIDYPDDFELFWDIYPHNHCVKKDVYKLWQEYSDEERSQFLLGAKYEHLYWNYIRHGETRMSNRCDRWMDSFVAADEKEKLLETMKQVINIKDEEVMNNAIVKAKEFFGEDKVRWALIKNTQRIVLDFH